MSGELLAKNDVNSLVESGTFRKSSSGDYTLGAISNYVGDFPPLYDFYHDHYHHYYPWPQTITVTPNKTETAFKIVKVLLDKGLVKIERIKTFIHLMDEIVKVL